MQTQPSANSSNRVFETTLYVNGGELEDIQSVASGPPSGTRHWVRWVGMVEVGEPIGRPCVSIRGPHVTVYSASVLDRYSVTPSRQKRRTRLLTRLRSLRRLPATVRLVVDGLALNLSSILMF